jgi:hypothetical protein
MMDLKKKKGGCGCGCGGPGGGCTCGSVESQKCGVTTMVRPRFFPGQLLVDGDLQLLVDYTSLKHRLHNRFLHGAGVVCGLQVGCHPCGGGKVVVGPGMALDCCGNDIIVPCPVELDIIEMIRQLRLSHQPGYDCGDPCGKSADKDDPRRKKISYCLWIRYCEEQTDFIAPYTTDDQCSANTCQAARVREGYSFELRCRDDEEEEPDTVWKRIECCVGDLELSNRAADHANSLSYFTDRTAFASYQIRNNAPVPFEAADVDAMREGTAKLQAFTGAAGRANAEAKSEIEIRRALDALQYTASAVVRWDLQPENAKETFKKNSSDPEEQVSAARAAVQDAGPVLAAAAAKVITSPRDRLLASESAAQATRWTAEEGFNDADELPRQYFAYNAWYSNRALGTMADAMTQLRDWLIEAIKKRGLFADCKLLDEVLKVQIPQGNSGSPESTRTAAIELISVFLRYLIDCVCAALNPPCQPCEDSAVKLACLDVENCEVIKICNLERTYVLTGPAFRYWIPFLHEIGELLEYACCKLVVKLRPTPEPQQPEWNNRRSMYYAQTAPAARVLDDHPEISMLLRLIRITPETAKNATNFSGSTASLLKNQPALDFSRQLGILREVGGPTVSGGAQMSDDLAAEVKERVGSLTKEIRDVKARLTRMEKNK